MRRAQSALQGRIRATVDLVIAFHVLLEHFLALEPLSVGNVCPVHIAAADKHRAQRAPQERIRAPVDQAVVPHALQARTAASGKLRAHPALQERINP
jgi:hypothetical protein